MGALVIKLKLLAAASVKNKNVCEFLPLTTESSLIVTKYLSESSRKTFMTPGFSQQILASPLGL